MSIDRKKIIMVDDDRTNLTVASEMLGDKYTTFTVTSGNKLFGLLEKVMPDIILLDVEMPEMSGYEVIKMLKNSEKHAHVPVIFLTSLLDPENEVKGLSLGAVDYLYKPFAKELLRKRIEMHLLMEYQKRELKRYTDDLEGMVFEKTQTVFELQNAILKTVAELVECRDNITGGHIERTQNYLKLLITRLLESGTYADELSTWDIDLLVMSSQLHDVGKISVKDDILMKPGKLTSEEFAEMQRHAEFGRQIIERIGGSTSENAFLEHAKILAGSHHERWDGSGYPDGLKGEEIPLQGRLMAVVDVYDALTNKRPYKEAFTHEKSVEVIKEGAGAHFDPKIVDVFLKHEQEFASGKITHHRLLSYPQFLLRLRSKKNRKSRFFSEKSGVFPIYRRHLGLWSNDNADYESTTPARLNTIFKTVSSIANIRNDTKGSPSKKIQHYLQIFVNALLQHDRFRDEVLTWDIEIFLMSAQLHDVGKTAISSNVLDKTEKLTDDEFEDVKSHVGFGSKIIRLIRGLVDNESLLHHAEILAGSHHEKWDGTGYPKGLRGKEIPLQGRIMAVVDVYNALTHHRPHRSMYNHKEAVDIIESLSGTQFDPDLVAVFLEHEDKFERAMAV